MNIEQYRALKAQGIEEAKEQTQPEVEEVVQTETVPEEREEITEEVNVDKVDDEETPPTTPTTVEIDGEEVDIEELRRGYLRQSDYTKKTQEVSRQRKEAQSALEFYNQVQANPDMINQQSDGEVPLRFNPTVAKVEDLEAKMYEMMVEKEISDLQAKYKDFEVMDVLNMAEEKNIVDLEDAYLLVKARKGSNETVEAETFNADTLREQIKKELLEELKSESVSTRSVISSSSSGQAIKPKEEIQLSSKESKVASMMGLSPKEYASWRDADNK